MADPRIGGDTVNQILQDLAIRHGVALERLKGSEVRRLLDILAEADDRLLARLERRFSRLGPIEKQRFGFGLATTERLQKLREAVNDIADDSFSVFHGPLAASMLDVGKAEVEFQSGAVNAVLTLRSEWVRPSNATLRALVRSRPFAGKLLREHTQQWSRGKRDRVLAAIRSGIVNGDELPITVKEIRRIVETSKEGAERIARTAIGHVSNAARQEVFRANKNVIRGVKWLATLDSRTCRECGSLDGRVFPVDGGRRPPAHLNCRCVTVPITKKTIGQGKRASSNGDVPEDVTFAKWLKSQTKADQVEVLGKTGAKLFRDGKLPLDGFVDKSGRHFTLDELRTRNAKAFERAGVD